MSIKRVRLRATEKTAPTFRHSQSNIEQYSLTLWFCENSIFLGPFLVPHKDLYVFLHKRLFLTLDSISSRNDQ